MDPVCSVFRQNNWPSCVRAHRSQAALHHGPRPRVSDHQIGACMSCQPKIYICFAGQPRHSAMPMDIHMQIYSYIPLPLPVFLATVICKQSMGGRAAEKVTKKAWSTWVDKFFRVRFQLFQLYIRGEKSSSSTSNRGQRRTMLRGQWSEVWAAEQHVRGIKSPSQSIRRQPLVREEKRGNFTPALALLSWLAVRRAGEIHWMSHTSWFLWMLW